MLILYIEKSQKQEVLLKYYQFLEKIFHGVLMWNKQKKK